MNLVTKSSASTSARQRAGRPLTTTGTASIFWMQAAFAWRAATCSALSPAAFTLEGSAPLESRYSMQCAWSTDLRTVRAQHG